MRNAFRRHEASGPRSRAVGRAHPPKSYSGQDVAKLIHRFAKSHSPNATGGGSPVSVGQFQLDQFAKYATETKGVVLPNCGHWVPEECPDTFNPTILNFLADN